MAPDHVDLEVKSQLTPETALLAYERWKLAKIIVDRIGDAIYAYAQQRPLDLPNGLVLGPVQSSRETIVGPVARDVLRRLYSVEVADVACEVESSKAAIKRALRPLTEKTGKSLAELERQTLDEIRRVGGLELKVSYPVKEHRP